MQNSYGKGILCHGDEKLPELVGISQQTVKLHLLIYDMPDFYFVLCPGKEYNVNI
jgi:hypothetical protein